MGTPSLPPRPDEVRSSLLQWLSYGHVWVALAVAAQCLWTGLFLHNPTFAHRYAAAALLGAFSAYGVMRLARSQRPEEMEFANLQWYKRNRPVILLLVGLSGILALLLLWPLWPSIWKWLVPAIVLSFFYITPFNNASGRGIGLRTIPLMKAFFIAVIWAIATVAVPVRLDPVEHSTFTILALTCMRIPFILSLAITFDIRDVATDAPSLRTLPMVLGIGGAKAVALFFLLASALLEVVFLRGLGHIGSSWAILLGYAVGGILIINAKPVRNAMYYAIWVDGVMILVPICAWVGMFF